ncbi:MAG: hypothetical protein ACRELB_17120, partial [Polyangiaceae bacterium]
CGGCGNVCPSGDICNGGQCQKPCTAPQTLCPGEPGCFDLTTDNANCGTCGTACLPPAGGTVTGSATCTASKCIFSCPTDAGVADGGGPIVQCDVDSGGAAGCFDLTQASEHCGSCDTHCPSGQVCTQSTCCPQGDSFCSGQCIDTQTDPANCGGCNVSCASPATCSAGKCVGYSQTNNPTGVTFLDACSMTGTTVVLKSQGSWKPTGLLTLPIPFSFYGTAQTQFWLQNEGTMGVGAPQTGIFQPDGFPDCQSGGDPTTKYPAIVAFGDYDLATGPNGVCYAVQGTAPNRQFVATWSQATDQLDPGSVLTFSIALTETTNTIDLMYDTASGADGGIDPTVAGINATIGMQGKPAGTLVATPVSCATAFLTTTPTILRFTPAGP